MFRAGKYFNNNVNSPLVGNGIVCLLSIFYFARSIGSMVSLAYCEKKKIITIVYFLGIPLVVSMLACTLSKGIFTQAFCSAVNGFCSAFATATCMLRNETDILQVEFQKQRHIKAGGDPSQKEKYNKTTGIAELLISVLNLACSYVFVLVAALFYNGQTLSQVFPVWISGLIILAVFVIFFLTYGFHEPQWLQIVNKNEDASKNQSRLLLGNGGRFVEFFFDDKSLMLQTLGVKLYEAIRLLDYIFMLVMLQTHPYWKGLFLGRVRLICWATLGCVLAFALNQVILVKVINEKNAGPFMRVTALISIALYPLLNTIIANVGFRKPGWAVFAYFFSEFLKFFTLFILREGLFETINKSKRVQNNKERFRALGVFVESFFKFVCVLVLGSTITKFMKSMRIQQMNPYNYLISFVILCLPLFITYVLLRMGKLDEDEPAKTQSQQQVQPKQQSQPQQQSQPKSGVQSR